MASFLGPTQKSINPAFACFKGKNDRVRDQSFDLYLGRITKIKNSNSSDIEKFKSIAKIEKDDLRRIHKSDDLEKCNEEQLDYLVGVYNDVLEILRDIKPDLIYSKKDEFSEYRKHYKQIEDHLKNLLEARGNFTTTKLLRGVQSASFFPTYTSKEPERNVLHYNPYARHSPKETEHNVPKKDKPNPFSKKANPTGSIKKYREDNLKANKEGIYRESPSDIPPPPLVNVVTPKSPKRSSFFSPNSPKRSPKKAINVVTPPKESLIDSLSLSESLQGLGMEAKLRTKLSPSKAMKRFQSMKLSPKKTGGKTRKNKKN